MMSLAMTPNFVDVVASAVTPYGTIHNCSYAVTPVVLLEKEDISKLFVNG